GLVGLGLELQTRGVPEHQQRPPLSWWCPQSHVRLIRGPAGGALRPRFDLAGSLPADEPGMHVWPKIPVGRPAEALVTGRRTQMSSAEGDEIREVIAQTFVSIGTLARALHVEDARLE